MPTTTRRAAALACALCLSLVLAACGDDDGVVGEPGTTTTAPVAPPPLGDDTTTTAPDTDEAAVEAAVQAWLDALGTGELDTAWELTHPDSQEAFGGRAAFDASGTELAEGYGSWAGTPDATFTAVPFDEAEPGLMVVVVQGTVAKEGPPEPAADALPVRLEDGTPRVDPFHDLLGADAIDYEPGPGTEIGTGHTFTATVPAGPEAWFVIDAGAPFEPDAEPVDGDRTRYTAEAPTALAPGQHSLTVVLVQGGRAQAQAVVYAVEA